MQHRLLLATALVALRQVSAELVIGSASVNAEILDPNAQVSFVPDESAPFESSGSYLSIIGTCSVNTIVYPPRETECALDVESISSDAEARRNGTASRNITCTALNVEIAPTTLRLTGRAIKMDGPLELVITSIFDRFRGEVCELTGALPNDTTRIATALNDLFSEGYIVPEEVSQTSNGDEQEEEEEAPVTQRPTTEPPAAEPEETEPEETEPEETEPPRTQAAVAPPRRRRRPRPQQPRTEPAVEAPTQPSPEEVDVVEAPAEETEPPAPAAETQPPTPAAAAAEEPTEPAAPAVSEVPVFAPGQDPLTGGNLFENVNFEDTDVLGEGGVFGDEGFGN